MRGASDVMKQLMTVRLREGRASDDIKFLRSFEGKCGERGWRRRRFELVCCKQRCMRNGYESDAPTYVQSNRLSLSPGIEFYHLRKPTVTFPSSGLAKRGRNDTYSEIPAANQKAAFFLSFNVFIRCKHEQSIVLLS